MFHRLSLPSVGADINIDRTVVTANAALNAAAGVWYNLPRRRRFVTAGIGFKYIKNGQDDLH